MRYNIFNHVHRPLKEALLSTCITLSNEAKWDISSAQVAMHKVEETLQICDEQVKFEALKILPFVFEYEPSVWNNYTAEHYKVMNLCCDLKMLVQSFYKTKGLENKEAILGLTIDKFNEFVLVNYNHMDDEEAVLNEILWRYYNDTFIREMEKDMILSITMTKQPRKKELDIANAA